MVTPIPIYASASFVESDSEVKGVRAEAFVSLQLLRVGHAAAAVERCWSRDSDDPPSLPTSLSLRRADWANPRRVRV
jgi:hypothetical protein